MPTSKPFQLMPWLRLLRIPNLPSAVSNILMAYLLVNQTWTPVLPLVLLIVASAAMYSAGMILNDVFDFEIDLEQRPERPIPSGAISKSLAASVGFTLLIGGVSIASLCGASFGAGSSWAWRTGILATILAVCIVLYDGPLKRTVLAPFLMGGCRTLNILMGASTFVGLGKSEEGIAATGVGTGIEGAGLGMLANNELLGLPLLVWWIAIAIGGLIAGATLLGRNEAAKAQNRFSLVFGALLVTVSLIGLAGAVYCPSSPLPDAFQISETQKTIFPMFIGFMSLTILRRVFVAAASMKPASIQLGVVSVLRSLIIIDAAICYLAVPYQITYALVVLSLLIPTLWLGRIFAST